MWSQAGNLAKAAPVFHKHMLELLNEEVHNGKDWTTQLQLHIY